MPINRSDGRHWCAPERKTPPGDNRWACPDDGVVWVYDPESRVWTREDEL